MLSYTQAMAFLRIYRLARGPRQLQDIHFENYRVGCSEPGTFDATVTP